MQGALKCRGVIIDLDGTIANTLYDIWASVNAGLWMFGLPAQSMDAVRQFVGDGLPELCRRAMAGRRLEDADRLAAVVLEQYRLHDLDHTTLYDGVPDLLDGLTARGVPMAVLSNKPHAATARMVDALCGRWRFVAVQGYTSDDRRKPDPRTALEIIAKMGAEPAGVVMLGDSQADIATGKAAGLVSVAATWGFRSRAVLEAAGPDFMIDRPTDLLSLIDGTSRGDRVD